MILFIFTIVIFSQESESEDEETKKRVAEYTAKKAKSK
jgi:hypothetical protein